MTKMLDHNGTPRSGAEQVARAAIEQSCGRQLTDGEWAKQRRRLIEFILTLARWDLERQLVEPRNIQPEVSQQAMGDEEACKTFGRPD